MGLRQGVYIGVYAPVELKEKLRERGKKAHRTLSQEVIRTLTKSVYGKAVPFDEVGKESKESINE